MTVDYERGNFSISQCSWTDGATPQISSIISPDYPANATSIPPGTPEESGSKKLSTGIIAAIAIITVLLVAGLAALAFFCIRRRKRPVSEVPTEDLNLTHGDVSTDSKSILSSIALSSIASPAPIYKKFSDTVPSHMHEHYLPRVELPTPAEENVNRVELPTIADMSVELPASAHEDIHQLPDHDNRDGDYFTATRAIRVAQTPEIGGEPLPRTPGSPGIRGSRRGIVFELQGSDNRAVEMDDEESRSGLTPGPSPMVTPNDPARASPRIPSPMSPLSPWGINFYDDRPERR